MFFSATSLSNKGSSQFVIIPSTRYLSGSIKLELDLTGLRTGLTENGMVVVFGRRFAAAYSAI